MFPFSLYFPIKLKFVIMKKTHCHAPISILLFALHGK